MDKTKGSTNGRTEKMETKIAADKIEAGDTIRHYHADGSFAERLVASIKPGAGINQTQIFHCVDSDGHEFAIFSDLEHFKVTA